MNTFLRTMRMMVDFFECCCLFQSVEKNDVDDEKSGTEQFVIGEEKLDTNKLVNSLFEKASKKVFDSSQTLSSNEMRALLIKFGFLSE
jgi:hypothetical protein